MTAFGIRDSRIEHENHKRRHCHIGKVTMKPIEIDRYGLVEVIRDRRPRVDAPAWYECERLPIGEVKVALL